MDLETLQNQFQAQKDACSESLSEMTSVFKEYSSEIDSVLKKISDAIELNKQNKEKFEKEHIEAEKVLNSVKDNHRKEIDNHVSIIKSLTDSRENILSDTDELGIKKANLDKIISGMMVEYRSTEEQLLGLRGQVSATERRANELKEQESSLVKSIGDKSKIELELSSSIELKKKEHSRILEDITILESRK